MPPQDPTNAEKETLCGFKVKLGKLSRGTWTWTRCVINGVILLDGVAFALLSSHHFLPELASGTWNPEDLESSLSWFMPPRPRGHLEWPSPDSTGTYHVNTPFDTTTSSQDALWADQDLFGQVFNQSIEAEVQFAIEIKGKQYNLDFVRTTYEYLHTIEQGNRFFVNQNYDWALVELDPTDFPAGSPCLVNRYHDRFSATVGDIKPITTLAPPPEDRISDISTILSWKGSKLANRSIHDWGVLRMAMRGTPADHAVLPLRSHTRASMIDLLRGAWVVDLDGCLRGAIVDVFDPRTRGFWNDERDQPYEDTRDRPEVDRHGSDTLFMIDARELFRDIRACMSATSIDFPLPPEIDPDVRSLTSQLISP